MKWRYQLIIRWSDEDKCYIAEVPDLPGCMAHGETLEEALKEVQTAARGWIAAARQLGRPIPRPKKQVVTF